MKNKSTAIVTAFSILVFVVLGIVIYQAYKKQTDGLTSSSYIESVEDVVNKKKPEPRSIELASKDSKTLVIKGIRAESKDTNAAKSAADDLKSNTQAPALNIDANSEVVNRPAVDATKPVQPNPTPNTNTYTFVAPTPVVITPQPAPAPYVAPPEKTRFQSYQEAIAKLRNRGSEIIIPVMNSNNSLLSITADPDVYNILSYEYELNASKKGYAGFGSKTHIDTLKCERYISSCKTILTEYPNGRYYVVLSNVELYSR
jgi:hypothetical protein